MKRQNTIVKVIAIMVACVMGLAGGSCANSAQSGGSETPVPENRLKGKAPSSDMQASDITKPEARPEKITWINHSLNQQKAEMRTMAGKCDLLMVDD